MSIQRSAPVTLRATVKFHREHSEKTARGVYTDKTCTQFHSMNQVTIWSKNNTIYQRNAENKGMDLNDTQTTLKYPARDIHTNNKTKLQSAKDDETLIKWKVNPTPPQRNYCPESKYRRKFFKYRPHYLTNPTTIHAHNPY